MFFIPYPLFPLRGHGEGVLGPSEDAADLMSSFPSPPTLAWIKHTLPHCISNLNIHKFLMLFSVCVASVAHLSTPRERVTFPVALPRVSSSSQKGCLKFLLTLKSSAEHVFLTPFFNPRFPELLFFQSRFLKITS